MTDVPRFGNGVDNFEDSSSAFAEEASQETQEPKIAKTEPKVPQTGSIAKYDTNDRPYTLTYDQRGNLVEIECADGQLISASYDANHQLKTANGFEESSQ